MARKQQQTKEAQKSRSDIVERRNVSRDWMRKSFYDDFEEVYRFYKVRTEAIVDENGVEDTSRTNVCMPDFWTIGRRKAARLSRRPPTLRVHSSNEEVAKFLSHWTAYQWDRAGEQKIQQRHVLQAELFGLSLKKHWWDKVIVNRKFRKSSKEVLAELGVIVKEDEGGESFTPATRQQFESGESVAFSKFSDEQKASILQSTGPELVSPTAIRQYEGPVSSFVFIGDYYPEPEFESVSTAAWNIFEDVKDLEWLAYMAQQTYTDPNTGEEKNVFPDTEALDKLVKQDNRKLSKAGNQDDEDLRRRLRDVIFHDDGDTNDARNLKLIPGKRFHIIEQHAFIEGWPWVSWVANEDIFLGKMPYPWDLYGNYAITPFTPIPDLLTGVGDSSPRALRYLMRLHNVTVAQRTDLLNQVLKPLLLMQETADIPEEVTDRGLYRILKVANLNAYKFEQQPSIPAAAWETERQILQMMQLGEPAMINFGAQSQAVPQSQRVATLGLLQQKASESLADDELEQLNESLAQETRIKLWMLQQTMQGDVDVSEFQNIQSLQAGQDGTGPRETKRDILELQEEFEVFPEMGSTLALDDVDRRREALEIYQLAREDDRDEKGVIWNKREAATRVAATLKGRGALNLINEPIEPKPQVIPPKLSISINWKDMTAEEKAQFSKLQGLEVGQQNQLEAQAESIETVKEIGENVGELAEQRQRTPVPEQPEPEEE